MNNKLKVIIFIQAFIVVFLLGILLGMKIQKNRMKDDGETIEQETANLDNASDSEDIDQEKPSDSSNQNNTVSSDNENSDNSSDASTEISNHVTVDRDVDYGAMDVPEPLQMIGYL